MEFLPGARLARMFRSGLVRVIEPGRVIAACSLCLYCLSREVFIVYNKPFFVKYKKQSSLIVLF